MKSHRYFHSKESTFKLLSTTLLTTALVACGGGGGSNNTTPDDDIDDIDNHFDDTSDLIVEPSCTPPPTDYMETKFGADGDFSAICDNLINTIELANDIPSMNVVNVERTTKFNTSCSDGSTSKGTLSFDYKTGIATTSGSFNGQPMSCTNQYSVQLPTTISTPESIQDLLFNWGDDEEGLISSTCPHDENETDDTVSLLCTSYSVYNITVTDDRGNKHKVAGKTKLTY